MGDGRVHVLVVEDDCGLREMYDRALSARYTVSTAPTGADAVAAMTEAIDVVLLDRRLPDTSACDLVEELPHRHDCSVALVTALEPDFDIVEMAVDDYLRKPVTTDRLCATVERLASLAASDDSYRELCRKRAQRRVLARAMSASEIRHRPAFERLREDIERLETELDGAVETPGASSRGLEL